ncbi:Rab3 GTPase-activating protein non-catalytic subunit [Blattella germanica]|nr:Rab3 GTPase-activating protein non-catalytic subunit [Blattella germanica]
MSCQIKTIASLIDVDTVKKYLFSPDNENDSTDPWEWPEEDSQKTNGKGPTWLQECCLSLSSTREILVIAHKNVMIILTSKWDSQEEGEVKTKYHITWHGNPCENDNETITSVLCLPLITQGKSSQIGPDWTCIIVGLSSGFVRFYTENCSLLLSELLHNEPVTYLKCQSFDPARFSTEHEHNEELYIIYRTAVCILMGFGLFQTLRACRNQLARVQANCGDTIKAPPLTYKKWGFREHERIIDTDVVGPATDNTFDHLVTASLRGGFNSSYRSSAPQTSLILAAGTRPYVGFHYALEGEATPVLADVTKAVYSKLKSAIGQAVPSWILGGSKKAAPVEKVKEKIPIEPAEPMGCRFGICDALRYGERISLSPNRKLSVVSDSFGRVVLIDNLKGVTIRMWKGYRDAQCGWLEVQEETRKRDSSSRNSPHPRLALFLVIYAPKQGAIEIWAMEQGPKVAKFTANKCGRLLHINHGIMGLNNIPLKGGNRSLFGCVFFDPSGLVKDISVPFHFALSDKNSKRARDLHLLKKLKTFLKEDDYDDDRMVEEVQKTMQELKTNEIRTQTVEMLSTNKHISPDALGIALDVVIDKLVGQEPDSLDHDGKTLQQMAQQLQKLVTFYKFVHLQHEIPPVYNTVCLSSLLNAPEREVNGLRNLVATIDSVAKKAKSKLKVKSEAKVAFREDGKTGFIEFLSCFDVGNSAQDKQKIKLKNNLSEDKIKRSSELVYQGTLYSDTKVEDWKAAAADSCIEPAHLMQLALQFWLQKREGAALEAEMLRFTELLKAICSLEDVNVICPEYNELSSWWREVRNVLKESTNPFMALTGAIVCRAVALYVEKEKESKGSSGTSDAAPLQESSATSPEDEMHSSASEWENVSRDTCQWSLIIGQLEDVALLDTVLRQKPEPSEKDGGQMSLKPQIYCCPYGRPSVSLSYVLSKGKGSVSELVAQWLSCSGVDPTRLVDLSDIEFDNMEQQEKPTEDTSFKKASSVDIKEGAKLDVEQGAEATPINEHEAEILANLSTLKRHFPYSLSSSILLANLCWEFIMTWHRNVDELEALRAAVKCLKTIPSPHLKEGVCSLIWSMHLKQRYESAARLFQKVGKIPKERLCRQEIGISDLEMSSFLNTCMNFLDTFMEANLMSAAQTPLDMSRYEELWNCDSSGLPTLVELALGKPAVNYELLHLHYQLAMALHMLASFNMRFPRPITSLFDNMGQAALFADLTSKPQLPSHNPDQALIILRTQFLCRIISGATQTIQRIESDDDSQDDKIMPAVQDPVLIASQLLLIVGQRLRQIVTNSQNMRGKMSQLSPSLSTWLDSLNEDVLKSNEKPLLEDLAQLLALIMQHLPEDHQEYHLALHMVDAVQAFINASST